MQSRYPDDVAELLRSLKSSLAAVDPEAAGGLAAKLLAANRIFTAGAGRSGLLLRCAAMRFMHLGLTVYPVGDVATPAIEPGDLLLIASGSGTTATSRLYADTAKAAGAPLALLTANPASPLAAIADTIICLAQKPPSFDCTPPLHPMGGFFEESLFLFLETVVLDLMRRSGIGEEAMFKRHANLE